MKLSDKSHRKIEQFFSQYLQDDDFRLPEIVFHAGRFTRFFTRIFKIEGITVGRRIFIFPDNFWRSETDKLRLDEALVVHEITHVLQYRREGFFKFLYKYLRDYRRNLKTLKKRDSFSRAMAYLEIPFELEAWEMERKYQEWKSGVQPEKL